MKVLFVGLGRMGWPMAEHLLKNNHEVKVHNRTASKAEEWALKNSSSVHTANDKYDAIILCVNKDDDVENLLIGETNLLAKLNEGGFVVDHTTTSINLAVRMADVASERGVKFYDAPVSGGEIGAQTGKLVCMMGGDQAHAPVVKELLSAYCKDVILIGEKGTGQAAKMANQFCIAGTLAGLSEAIHLLEKEPGLNLDHVFNAISGGAAQSWQMNNRFSTMVQGKYDFGFGIDLMLKDLGYALERAKEQGWTPDVAQKVHSFYEILSRERQMGKSDTSGLLEFYRNRDKVDSEKPTERPGFHGMGIA